MISNKQKLKELAYLFGKILGILGLGFVLYKLFSEYSLASLWQKLYAMKALILPLIIVNYLSMLIGVYAWRMMLSHYAKTTVPYPEAYYYFSKTEISKYLPGNIFHFVGRQVLASKIGLKQIEMAKVSLLHNLLLVVSTLFATSIFSVLSYETEVHDYLRPLLFLSALISLALLLRSYPTITSAKKMLLTFHLTVSIALQGVLMGWIVIVQIEGVSYALFFQVCAIYIISWLMGFVTPGASGGLGVREGTFMAIALFLNLNIPAEIIVFSVLFVRVINIVVDTLMYLSTFLFEPSDRLQ